VLSESSAKQEYNEVGGEPGRGSIGGGDDKLALMTGTVLGMILE
jgi:hypothetical protein